MIDPDLWSSAPVYLSWLATWSSLKKIGLNIISNAKWRSFWDKTNIFWVWNFYWPFRSSPSLGLTPWHDMAKVLLAQMFTGNLSNRAFKPAWTWGPSGWATYGTLPLDAWHGMIHKEGLAFPHWLVLDILTYVSVLKGCVKLDITYWSK